MQEIERSLGFDDGGCRIRADSHFMRGGASGNAH